MSFRPRYSLLAFLLFTAAVAGGVKLWRGPHRVVMSVPPTAEQKAILDRALMPAMHEEYLKPARYEYDFVRTWDGPVCSSVVGWPNNPTIPVLPTQVTKKFQLVPPQLAGVTSVLKQNSLEYLVCWVHSGHLKPVQNATTISTTSGRIAVTKHVTYYLSSHKRLYVDTIVLLSGIHIEQIDLADVSDPAVRARIEEALASIPDPK